MPPSNNNTGRWPTNLEGLPSVVPIARAALYQLVLDRNISERSPRAHADWLQQLRESDRDVIYNMLIPLASRFVNLKIRGDAEDWCA